MPARTRSAAGTASRRLRRFTILGSVIGAIGAYRHRTIGTHEARLPHVIDRRIPPPGTAAANGKAPARPAVPDA
jgi:hypothetical protein